MEKHLQKGLKHLPLQFTLKEPLIVREEAYREKNIQTALLINSSNHSFSWISSEFLRHMHPGSHVYLLTHFINTAYFSAVRY